MTRRVGGVGEFNNTGYLSASMGSGTEGDDDRLESSLRDDLVDHYDITEWEPRSLFDRLCAYLGIGSHYLVYAGFVVASAVLLGVSAVVVVYSPLLGAFTLASTVPAVLIVWLIWDTEPYDEVSLRLLTFTFLLCCVLSAVPYAVNSYMNFYVPATAVGTTVFFFLIVAPIEEMTKWLAVRLYGYNDDFFDSALDGAVLGAVAGLAFAVVESALYISGGGLCTVSLDAQSYWCSLALPSGAGEMTLERTAVAPLHVLMSSISGYYLGLAKLNTKWMGAVVLKGLLIAVFVHGTYNTFLVYVPEIAGYLGSLSLTLDTPVTATVLRGGFVLGVYAVVSLYLGSKLRRHKEYTVALENVYDVRSVMEMSDDEVDDFLLSRGTGVLSLSRENESYSVPVTYGYRPEDGFFCLVLSYSPNSEKREWVRNTETVSFVVYDLEPNMDAESVVVRGSLVEVEDDEMEDAHEALSNNALFTVSHQSGASERDTDFVVYRVDVDSITGRKFEGSVTRRVERESEHTKPFDDLV